MAKFKVGDKVETPEGEGTIVDANNPKYGFPYAVNLDKASRYCEFRNEEPYHIPEKTRIFNEGNLKLVNKTMEFKIGDKVKGECGAGNFTGQVVRIENDTHIIIDRDDDRDGWICSKKPDGSWGADDEEGILTSLEPKEPDKPDPDNLELTLPPKAKELLIKNLPELIKKGYLTDEYKVTPKGDKRLLELIKKL